MARIKRGGEMKKFLKGVLSVFAGVGLISLLTVSSQAQWHNGNHCIDWPDSLETVTVSGVAILDTLYMHTHYYLDVDANDTIDYQLAFGPWWYEPESGAQRPAQGDTVTIFGGLFPEHEPPLIVVFEINGLVWRDSGGRHPGQVVGYIEMLLTLPLSIVLLIASIG